MKNIGTALLLGIFGLFMYFTSNGNGNGGLNSLNLDNMINSKNIKELSIAAPLRELSAPISTMQATLITAAASVTPAQTRSRSLREMCIDEAIRNSKETPAERARNTMGQTYSR